MRVRRVPDGLSQGGMLSLLLACKHPGQFGAVAPVAGMIDLASCQDRSTPVIAFHGTADRTVGYDGKIGPNVQWLVGYAQGPTVPELAAEWQAQLVTNEGGHSYPPGAAEAAWTFFASHST